MQNGTAVGPEPLAYSVRHTAALLSVSARTIYNLIDNGTINAIELGGRKLISRHEIDRILQRGGVTE